MILDHLYGKGTFAPADFGEFVTPATIANHNETENRKRAAWLKKNPEAIAFMHQCLNN